MDSGLECGRWDNGRLKQHCDKAGTEYCQLDCPYGKQIGKGVATTCIEHAYGTAHRLSFQIKVF